MEDQQIDHLEDPFKTQKRRRKMLPIWIKVFIWIFMFFGALAPIGIIFGMARINFQLSLYGLETTQPFSVIGIALILIFLFKGAVAYSLWTERDWAVNLAMIDGIIGILVCILVMFGLANPLNGFTFRLELILLVPYLYKMRKIKEHWDKTILVLD